MRALSTSFALALCLVFVPGFVSLAAGQSSHPVLPPHSVRVNPLPLQPAKPGTRTYVPPAAGGPFWTKVTNTPAASVGAMLLLTDGRVLVHEEPNCSGNGCSGMDYTAWFVLTPDATGSYINGTWSQVGSMPPNYAPLYFGSAVLPNGKVMVQNTVPADAAPGSGQATTTAPRGGGQ